MIRRFVLMCLLSLPFAFAACGGGKSACEAGTDVQIDSCGFPEDQRSAAIAICETLPQDQVQRCLDCTVDAPDPCTANDPGGPCEDICNFDL